MTTAGDKRRVFMETEMDFEIYMCTYTFMSMYVYVYIYTQIYFYIYFITYKHIYTYTCLNIYICVKKTFTNPDLKTILYQKKKLLHRQDPKHLINSSINHFCVPVGSLASTFFTLNILLFFSSSSKKLSVSIF